MWARLVMGFYDGSATKLWEYAKRYTLADHFFQAAFGGSFLNHFWLICACTPRYEKRRRSLKVAEPDGAHDDAGNLTELLKRPDKVTPDGYAVNTLQPFEPAAPRTSRHSPLAGPCARSATQLSEQGMTWAWYAGGWDDAVAGHASARFPVPPSALRLFQQIRYQILTDGAITEGRQRT